MQLTRWSFLVPLLAVLAAPTAAASPDDQPVDRWMVAVGRAAGEGPAAQAQARDAALRKAVEQACGVFLAGQSRSRDYQTVYDRVLTNSAGYVREFQVTKAHTSGGVSVVEVRARVSTRRFAEDWAAIAHTIEQENNPRLVVAVLESVQADPHWDARTVKENGIVQGRIEDFLLGKGLTLMDRTVAGEITKRDVLLAAIRDEPGEVASLGARFDADVVVTGRAGAKYGKAIEVAGQTMHQYVATLSIRVIQTDSARVLASKSFGPITVNTMQRTGGEDRALARLGEESAPKLLEAVVDAWRRRAHDSRTVSLTVTGMDYELWKLLRDELADMPGLRNVRLREITAGVAHIDLESELDHEALADHLGMLGRVRLRVTEITANRLKLKVAPETDD